MLLEKEFNENFLTLIDEREVENTETLHECRSD
jgi:hypothetical protein